MRKCHLNTCPVGVATQDPTLRQHFNGKPEYLVNYFTFIATEVRELLAELGFERFDDIIGKPDLLSINHEIQHWKPRTVDVSSILYLPAEAEINSRRFIISKESKIDQVMDRELLQVCIPAIEKKEQIKIERTIRNTDRAIGAMLSGRITEKLGPEGLPDDTIHLTCKGSAGQSFGAFLAKGITLKLEGDANDYLGKGLSGGRIIVVPPEGSEFPAEKNIIVGNTILYGATSGEVFIRGIAGERFCVRNSGAIAVVEGVGDHCCEYMTGGRVVILGTTGRNFAAGMSGGIAYVYNDNGNFDYYCNMGMVELSLVEDLAEIKELKELILKHYEYTGSKRAKDILEQWDNHLSRFIKVVPYEYMKVLEEEKLEFLKKKIEQVETDPEIRSGEFSY